METLPIHCLPSTITKLTVNDIPASFSNVKGKTLFDHSTGENPHFLAMSDETEISVYIPKEVEFLKSTGFTNENTPSTFLSPTYDGDASQNAALLFQPIIVRLDFLIKSRSSSIVFYTSLLGGKEYPYVYNVNSRLSTRFWLPTIDFLSERCTWDIEVRVPTLKADVGKEFNVICSGEFQEKKISDIDPSKTCFLYTLSFPSPSSCIYFTAGIFENVQLSMADAALIGGDAFNHNNSLMEIITLTVYYPPGYRTKVLNSCSFLMKALYFYEQDFGSYPFLSYKLLFIQGTAIEVSSGAGITIASSDLLHGPEIIEQTYETRRVLSQALASQWFGNFIFPKTWCDQWLVIGLMSYLAGQFLRKLIGTNEHRFRVKKDMYRVCKMDVSYPSLFSIYCDELAEFVQLKGSLVLYMLNKRMIKGGGSSVGLNRVIPKILVAAISGEMLNNALSSHSFLRVCRKVSNVEVKGFADQWIYGTGCPKFQLSYFLNRKKMLVEFHLKQSSTNIAHGASLFTGPFKIRVHESTSASYEHVFEISGEPEQKFEIPFSTKGKKLKKMKKDLENQEEQMRSAELIEGPEKGHPFVGIVEWEDMGVPDDETSLYFDWIRADADFDWLCELSVEQADFMWSSQLRKDRDVVAQLEAVTHLAKSPSPPAATSLLRIILDQQLFYRVRMEACIALAQQPFPYNINLLIGSFQKMFCYPDSSIPSPNNFYDLAQYFVKKIFPYALSLIRDDDKKVPPNIKNFLLNLIINNDNCGNEFSDCYYLASLIRSLGSIYANIDMAQKSPSEGDPLINEIERFRSLDCILPSYHNVTTVACLESLARLMMQGILEKDILLFLTYSRYGNSTSVRLMSFQCVISLNGILNPRVFEYLCDVITFDKNEYIRLSVAKAMVHWGKLIYLGSACFHSQSPLDENNSFENEYTLGSSKVKTDKLVHEIQNSKELRSIFQDSLKSLPIVDLKIMDCLKSFQIIFFPSDINDLTPEVKLEPMTKLILKVPPPPPDLKEVSTKIYIPTNVIPEPQTSVSPEVLEKEQKISPPLNPHLTPMRRILNSIKKHNGTQLLFGNSIIKEKMPITLEMVSEKVETGAYSAPMGLIDDIEVMISSYINLFSPDSADINTIVEYGHHIRKVSSSLCGKAAIKNRLEWSHLLKRKKTEDGNEDSSAQKMVPTREESPKVSLNPKEEKGKETPSKSKEKPAIQKGVSYKFYKKVLRKLCTHSSASPFLRPVDPIADGIPNYFNIITSPMDLSTIRRKLDSSEYACEEDFEIDVRIMFSNCFKFNAEGTHVFKEGKALEKAFNGLWRKKMKSSGSVGPSTPVMPELIPVDVTLSEKLPETDVVKMEKPSKVGTKLVEPTHHNISGDIETLKLLLEKMKNFQSSSPFLYPVDPVALGIPDYFDIIKKPMDLKTIEVRLSNHSYSSKSQFRDDVILMLNNCYSFNLDTSWVFQQGKKLQHFFEKEWLEVFGESVTGFLDNHPPPKAPVLPISSLPSNAVSTFPIATSTPKKILSIGQHELDICDEILSELIIQSAEFLSIHEKIRKIKGKLHDDRYPKVSDLKQDLLTMLTKKEAPGTRRLQDLLETLWKEKLEPKPESSMKSMDPALHKQLTDILQKLVRHKASFFFRNPVNKYEVPNYYEIIKSPMDLQTIGERLQANFYVNENDFEKDVTQIFTNCYTFNPVGSVAYEQGKTLESIFEKTMKAMFPPPKPPKPEESQTKRNPTASNPLKECDRILKKLYNRKESYIFHEPVDAIALGVPHYYDIIKDPMDFGTIRHRLSEHVYTAPEQFESDVRLVFQNCRIFNPPDTIYYQYANTLEQVFDKEWTHLLQKHDQQAMSSQTKQVKDACRKILDGLKKHDCSLPFLVPVDPVALGIPHYFDVIRQPMDLSTIEKKLSSISSLADFVSDVKLMFHNCYTFNHPESEVYIFGQRLEAEFQRLLDQHGSSISTFAASHIKPSFPDHIPPNHMTPNAKLLPVPLSISPPDMKLQVTASGALKRKDVEKGSHSAKKGKGSSKRRKTAKDGGALGVEHEETKIPKVKLKLT